MAHDAPKDPNEKPGWADNPKFIERFLNGLYIACGIAAVLGFFFGKSEPHFDAERLPVFFAAYGFAMFALIVLVGQHLRKLVARPEEYYDERE